MQPARLSPPWRTFIAALTFGVLLAGMLWLRPKFGGIEFLLGFAFLAGFVAVLPICLLILVGRPPQPGKSSRRETFWIFFVAAVGLPLAVGLMWLPRQPIDHVAIPVLGVVLCLILFVDIPLCVLILVGYPATMTLSPLVSSAAERAKWREMRQRPQLSDDEFLERYYAATSIPRDIPLHLRSVYSEQLGIDRVQPDDIATDFDGELDLWDLAMEVQHVLGVQFTLEEVQQLAGSFDSFVRAVAAKRGEHVNTQGDKGTFV